MRTVLTAGRERTGLDVTTTCAVPEAVPLGRL
jgi:hypothetical protein